MHEAAEYQLNFCFQAILLVKRCPKEGKACMRQPNTNYSALSFFALRLYSLTFAAYLIGPVRL